MMQLNPMVVRSRRELAPGIVEFELVAPDGAELPPFEPGAHVHVGVPAGGTRQYSLVNDPAETRRYVIAVKREDAGKGGSVSLIDNVAPGDGIGVSEPRNDFRLADTGEPLLIAGGIGITPLLCMAQVLERAGRPFRLIYLTRDRAATAYAAEIEAWGFADRVTLHHDGGDPAQAIDLAKLLAEPGDRVVHACGPTPLLHAIRAAAGHWPRGSVRFEDFGTAAPVATAACAPEGGFWVGLDGTPERHFVGEEDTILQVLQRAGLDVPSSCEAGTCGTCRMRLVSGEPDHRDLVLFDDEMEDNIIICCSRAHSAELVIAPLP